MRIAYVTSTFPCWSETFVLAEILDHRASGHDVAVFSLKKSGEKMVHDAAVPLLEDVFNAYGVHDPRLWAMHARLAIANPRSYFSTFFAILLMHCQSRVVWLKSLAVFLLSPRFVFLVRAKEIERLHAHFATYPALLSWIVGRFTAAPYSVTAHAHDLYVNQDILALIWRDADFLVTISEYNRKFIVERLGEEAGKKTRVIHCGIDLDRFAFSRPAEPTVRAPGPLRIVSIGRLTEIKGFPVLIDALALLRNEEMDFLCDIVGEGPMRAELVRRIRNGGLEGKVRLLGAKRAEEIPGILGKADLFVLACSKGRVEGQDGIPVVLMEAMALGVPVVGTRISGVPELVRDRETGLCVDPERPDLLRDAIKYMAEKIEDAGRMSLNARRLVEAEFSIGRNSAILRKTMAEKMIQR